MGKPRIVLSDGGMEELLKSEGVRNGLREPARRVAARARETAPVATGAYRDAITVWDDTTDRAVVRVGSRDRKSPIIEARTGNMARALDAAGGA